MGDENYEPNAYAAPESDLGPGEPELDPQSRQWAMFAHLAGLAMYVGLPLGNILGPLIVWMIKKDEMPFVDDQGKEALNFHISMTIYLFVAGISALILIGFFLIPVVMITEVILTIIGAINANAGTYYRYPLTIRIIN